MEPTKADDRLLDSEQDLLDWMGRGSPEDIAEWIQEESDLVDYVEAHDDEEALSCVLFSYTLTGGAQFALHLPFPFLASTLLDRIDRVDHYFRAAINAAFFNESEATLGVVGADDDKTEDLATELLGVSPEDLDAALAGPWEFMELDVDQDFNGEPIYAWFVPSDERRLALGIGINSLYLVPLLGDNEEGWFIDEWPQPAVAHWWDEDWADAEADIEVDDIGQTNLEHLVAMMATFTGGTAPPPRTSAHTVRLSTRNLLVGGIDLDFEVKQGGRMLGTLSVSKGGLQWRSARNHRRKGRAKAGTRIKWSDFADWADRQ